MSELERIGCYPEIEDLLSASASVDLSTEPPVHLVESAMRSLPYECRKRAPGFLWPSLAAVSACCVLCVASRHGDNIKTRTAPNVMKQAVVSAAVSIRDHNSDIKLTRPEPVRKKLALTVVARHKRHAVTKSNLSGSNAVSMWQVSVVTGRHRGIIIPIASNSGQDGDGARVSSPNLVIPIGTDIAYHDESIYTAE